MQTLLNHVPSFMDTSRPDLLPIDGAARDVVTLGGGACAAVDRGVLDDVVAAIAGAVAKADDNLFANGPSVAGARYPAAAAFAKDGCQAALDTMDTLVAWLVANDLFESPGDQVSNASASFNIFGYCREAISQLHFARHWAAVSSSHNAALDGAGPGRACTELISGALALIEPLSADATSCYLRSYL